MVKDSFFVLTVIIMVLTKGNINIRDYIVAAIVFFLLDRMMKEYLPNNDVLASIVDKYREVRHKAIHSQLIQKEIVQPIASIWRDVPDEIQKQFMDVSDVMAADEFLNLLREKQEQ